MKDSDWSIPRHIIKHLRASWMVSGELIKTKIIPKIIRNSPEAIASVFLDYIQCVSIWKDSLTFKEPLPGSKSITND